MFRSVLVLVFVASAGASRIQVHENDQSNSEAKLGASCEHLQTTFRNRLINFQSFLDANPDLDAVSRTAQVRVVMRTYGIIRPLRRARTCDWAIANDSEEIEQARGIVQTLLAGNPCANAARSELQAGSNAETAELEVQSLRRAVSVLSSDNCEVGALPEESANVDEDVDTQLSNAEDDLQDVIEELEDPVSQEGAFIQTDSEAGTFRGFMRGVGVVFLMLFLLLACAGMVAVISAFLGGAIYLLVYAAEAADPLAGQAIGWGMLILGTYSGLAGGALGLAACSYQLYTQLLPRLTQ